MTEQEKQAVQAEADVAALKEVRAKLASVSESFDAADKATSLYSSPTVYNARNQIAAMVTGSIIQCDMALAALDTTNSVGGDVPNINAV
jgi:hypothetical protein